MDQVGRVIMKKGAQMATKKFLDKQLNENKDRVPGGQWVSDVVQENILTDANFNY
jgi:hypothetical protein